MFRWYRKSLLLDSDNNYLIESRGSLHTFIIRSVSSEHFGDYTCTATNTLGRNSATIQLTGETKNHLVGQSNGKASGENLNYMTLAPKARQSRPSGEILNYVLTESLL